MFTFEGKCPHCGSDRGFHAFGISNYLAAEIGYSDNPVIKEQLADKSCLNQVGNFIAEYSLAGNCLNCNKPVVANCVSTVHARTEISNCLHKPDLNAKNKAVVLQILPKSSPPYSHPSLPEKVRLSFVDLQKMLQEQKQAHFIIFGCRAVLEAAVRDLGGEGKSLHERVEDLYAKGLITASLKDWASIIRRVGNEAAHEMAGTEEEAKELVAFTKVFLQFTFELPAVIAKNRA